MTVRAILLGLISAAIVCGVTFFNDLVLQQTMFVGNYLPISVFGGLFVFVLMVNPLLGAVRKNWALSGRELAVAMVITFAACYVPGRGLMHYFCTTVMWPHKYAETNPGWKKQDIIHTIPEQMLADPSHNREEALGEFLSGMSKGQEHISFSRIPWYAWTRTLLFWIPLIVTISIALIALATVLHRQWSAHEKLRYPIVTFAHSLLPEQGRSSPIIFRNKLFWLSTISVFVIHMSNYAYVWWPDKMIRIPVEFDFGAIAPSVPNIIRGGGFGLLKVHFYFTAIGFAYLLATDLSLSLGIAPYLYTWIAGVLMIYNIPIREGTHISLKLEGFLHAGAYFGIFLVLLYTGRRYFVSALARALFIRTRDNVPSYAVWGMRFFLLGSTAFICQLVAVGLDWQLAVLYTLGAAVIFTGISRVVAETGVFFIHSYHYPGVIMWGFLGASALGPKAMIIMFMVSCILLIDPREAIMPFMVNGLKLAESSRLKLGRVAVLGVVGLLVALAVAVPVTLYWHYDRGGQATSDGWTRDMVPRFSFDAVTSVKQDLKLANQLEEAEKVSGWGHFKNIMPRRACVWAFGIALALVLLFTFARLRFPRWPFHPVMFLVLGTWQSKQMGASFLAGWFIKMMVTRYMGGQWYQKLKPLMFGLIAGDLIGGLIPMIVGAIYYFTTGHNPEIFRILPT